MASVISMPAVKPRRANRGRMVFLTPEELLAVLKVARERKYPRPCNDPAGVPARIEGQ